MKTTIKLFSLAILASAFVACGGNPESTSTESQDSEATTEKLDSNLDGTYVVNSEESVVMWEGNMLKIGGVSLYGHNGTIDVAPSKIALQDGMIAKGGVVIDMTSIKPTDENYNPEEGRGKDDLIGHLSSPDFFDIANHPTAEFQVTAYKADAAANSDKIAGTMTIRGISNEEMIENVEMEVVDGKMVVKGNMTIDRQKYNVAFKMPAEDKILSDDIDLEFKIVADKAK